MNSSIILACIHSLGRKSIRAGWISQFWLLKDKDFIWLETLTMLVNNTIKIFSIISNILCHVFSMDIYEYWYY